MTIDEIIENEKEIADMLYDQQRSHSAYYHKQLAEWFKELKSLKQWKSDVMDGFCRYDASSFEELVANVRNKTVDDFVTKIKKYMETTEQATYIDEINNGNDNYSAMTIYDYVDELANELKVGENRE